MVNFHPTCADYSIPGVEKTDHTSVIREGLEHARELTAAGHKSVRGEKVEDPIVKELFEKYFGSYTTIKHDKVRVSTIILPISTLLPELTLYMAIFEKLSKFEVDGKDEISQNITVIVGIRHLSAETAVWLPKHSRMYPCVIDLSVQGFDTRGMLDSSRNALLPISVRSNTSENTLAFVDQEDDHLINAEGGKRIWIMPRTLSLTALQAPFGTNSTVSSYDHIDMYKKLPAILFHELSHTFLTGTVEKRLKDEKVVPIDLVTGTNSSKAELSAGPAAPFFKDPQDLVCM